MKPANSKENWKDVKPEDRNSFLEWLVENQKHRMEVGERKYNSSEIGFQGDPLQHAAEELFDALFYVFYAMRERDALKEKLAELRKRHQEDQEAQDALGGWD